MIASVEPLAAKSAATIYQLKIVLLGSKPLIWRRLLVPGDARIFSTRIILPRTRQNRIS